MWEVFPRLYLGCKDDARNVHLLKEKQICHVLNVTDDLPNYFEGATQVKVPTTKVSSVKSIVEEFLPSITSDTTLEQMEDLDNIFNLITATPQMSEVSPSQFEIIELDRPVIYKRISIQDSVEQNIKQHFIACSNFIQDSLDASQISNVLVHCREGRSRSVSIMIAYTIHKLQMSLQDAFTHIQRKTNNRIRINDGFKRQLMEFELECLENKRESTDTKQCNSLNFFDKLTRHKIPQRYEDLSLVNKKQRKKKKLARNPAQKDTIIQYLPPIVISVADASTQKNDIKSLSEQDYIETIERKKKKVSKSKKEKVPNRLSKESNKQTQRIETTFSTTNVIDKTGWSQARIKSFEKIDSNPNQYYYRHNAPGQSTRTGQWSEEEKILFLNRMKEVSFDPANPQWGIFSMAIPGRVGYVCSNFYRTLVQKGELVDPLYKKNENGDWHWAGKKCAEKRKSESRSPRASKRKANPVVTEISVIG